MINMFVLNKYFYFYYLFNLFIKNIDSVYYFSLD